MVTEYKITPRAMSVPNEHPIIGSKGRAPSGHTYVTHVSKTGAKAILEELKPSEQPLRKQSPEGHGR